jgi:hypothetical protein
MWARYMAIAFITNGLGAFGLRLLAGAGLKESHNFLYLLLWYAFGCLTGGAAYFLHNRKPSRIEVAVASGMAVCSVLGQLGMALAMENGFPGLVVFPVAIGGGMLLVLIAALTMFGERPGVHGYIGIGVGLVSLFLLVMS